MGGSPAYGEPRWGTAVNTMAGTDLSAPFRGSLSR